MVACWVKIERLIARLSHLLPHFDFQINRDKLQVGALEHVGEVVVRVAIVLLILSLLLSLDNGLILLNVKKREVVVEVDVPHP